MDSITGSSKMQASFSSARAFFKKTKSTPQTRRGSFDSTSSRRTTKSKGRVEEPAVWSECMTPAPSESVEQVESKKEMGRRASSPAEQSLVDEAREEKLPTTNRSRGSSFKGLSGHSLDLDAGSRFFDDDYLKNAFGITMERKEKDELDRRRLTRSTIILPSLDDSPPVIVASDSPEPLDDRSDPPISIPQHPSQTRKRSQGIVLSMIAESGNANVEAPGGAIASRHQHGTKVRAKPKPLTGLATSRLSAVSTTSGVQMPNRVDLFPSCPSKTWPKHQHSIHLTQASPPPRPRRTIPTSTMASHPLTTAIARRPLCRVWPPIPHRARQKIADPVICTR